MWYNGIQGNCTNICTVLDAVYAVLYKILYKVLCVKVDIYTVLYKKLYKRLHERENMEQGSTHDYPMTIKDYAKSKGKVYETIRLKIERFKDAIIGYDDMGNPETLSDHISTQNRTQYLDKMACDFLDTRNRNDIVTEIEIEKASVYEELEQYRKKSEEQAELIQSLQNKIMQMYEAQLTLSDKAGKYEALIEDKQKQSELIEEQKKQIAELTEKEKHALEELNMNYGQMQQLNKEAAEARAKVYAAEQLQQIAEEKLEELGKINDNLKKDVATAEEREAAKYKRSIFGLYKKI